MEKAKSKQWFSSPRAKAQSADGAPKGIQTLNKTAFKKVAPAHRAKNVVNKNTGAKAYTPAPKSVSSDEKFKIYPLGGNEEVGRNCTVFEYGNDIIILDMGHQFPEQDMHGIDYIIPNISSLKGKEKNIRAVILSHGHLDHVGAAPHLLPMLGNPLVIGTPLTLAILKRQIEDKQEKFVPKTLEIKDVNKPITLGRLKVHFFSITHSIKDAVGVVFETPYANVVHLGDWRYDLDPVEGPKTNMSHLTKWKNNGKPLVLMMESLGSTKPGHQGSEKEIYKKMEEIIKGAPGRVVFGTFSSMIDRVSQIMDIAEKNGRKVALDGYSMKVNVEVAQRFGFIKVKKNALVDIANIEEYPRNKIVIICTGSQGEDRAVLNRIANGDHRHVRVEPNDTIVFSSSVIPGNERQIQVLKDTLYRQGARVLHQEIMDVHAGGHGKIEDIKLLLREVHPDYLIPVYANHYLLREAANIAEGMGMPKNRILVADNGQIMEFDKNGGRLTKEKVDTSYVFVDGLGVGDVSHVVLRDRQLMAEDGMIVVIATIDRKTGKLVQNPDLISRGFIYMKEHKSLIEETRMRAKKIFKGEDLGGAIDENYYKDKIRNEIGKFLFQKTQRRPMVLPVIIEV